MIEASSYYDLYLLIVTLLTVFTSITYFTYPNRRLLSESRPVHLSGYIISIFFVFFIGFRPIDIVFADMVNYHDWYFVFWWGKPFKFNLQAENIFFDNFFSWLGANYIDIRVFFVLMAAIYFLCAYKAIIKMFPRDSVYGLLAFLAAFSTFSYGTNGIKAGAAASIFLFAIAYSDRRWLSYLFIFISWGFHHSMIMPIIGYFACSFVKNPTYYTIFWFFALAFAVSGFTQFQTFFALYTDAHTAEYLSVGQDWGGKTGFRYDFVFYSVIPLLVGWYAIFHRKFDDKGYKFIFNLYMFTNAVWMLCMYANFTNRIAYLSWFLYPIVLVYPFFKKEFLKHQYQNLNYVVWFQLIFTLAMRFIYYG